MGAEFYERPYNLVNTQIEAMSARADDALATAEGAINALLNIPSPIPGVTPPTLDLPDSNLPPQPPITAPKAPTLNGTNALVTPTATDGRELLQGFNETVDEIPAFVPPVTALNIPAAPAPLDLSGLPEAPILVDPTLPTAPAREVIEIGDLLAIEIPTFAGLTLPTFDALPPEFTSAAPTTIMAWSEPTYVSENLDLLKAKVKTMLMGGTGLPAVIEAALFDRARSRVDVEGERAVQEAFDTFAGRNFEMPPGMLVEAVQVARENNQLQANAASRDILVQAATWEIENLRFAVTQGVALEAQMIGMFMNMAERGFQAAKYRVEADIALYNAQVTLFNALNAGYQAQATVYAERIRGALASLEEFKARITAEGLKGTVNESTVKVYQARVEAAKQVIETYKAELSGVQALADMAKNRVERYRAQIQGYAERITGEKTAFDAFKTQVEGETAKVGLLEGSARAYAATIQGYEGKANIRVNNVRARVDALNASTQRFTALVGAERDRVMSDTEIAKTQIQGFLGEVEKYKVVLGDRQADRQLKVTQIESRLRNNIAAFEIYVKEYDAGLTRLIQEMNVRVEALKTVASATSQIAAGAFAAMHVSASLQGDAKVSDSYERQDVYRFDGSA
jgi:hypothetical protein